MAKLMNINKFKEAEFEEKITLLKKSSSEVIEEIIKLSEQEDRAHSNTLVTLINEIIDIATKTVAYNNEMYELLARYQLATTLTVNLDDYKIFSVDELLKLGFTPKALVDYIETQKRFIDHIKKTHDLLNTASELTVNLYLEWLYLIYLNLYAIFNINDYEKLKKLVSASVSVITSTMGFIPGVSTILGFGSLVNDLKDLMLTFNNKYLSKSYFDELDSKLQILEKQKNMLNDLSNIQMKVLKSLTLLVAYFEYDK